MPKFEPIAPDNIPGVDYYLEVLKEPGVFEYGGYHFKPYRRYGKGEIKRRLEGDSRKLRMVTDYVLRNIRSDFALGISSYDWGKTDYSHEKFYAASGNSNVDIFQCVENGNLYVPHEKELFQYKEPPQRTKSAQKKSPLTEEIKRGKQKMAEADAQRRNTPKKHREGEDIGG